VTGVLLAGYVTTWFGALREAPATMVTSILVVGAVVTGILSAVSNGAVPDGRVVVGYLLMVVAVVLVAAGGLRLRRMDAARALGDG
jgi:drug/metabolite transporter (DMT)-like permease